jgi:hypothetical protein
MSVTHPDMDAQFDALVAATGAERGDEEYYRGVVEKAPFLLKQMSANPPEYMLKFRMTEPHKLPSDWHDRLTHHYQGAGISCELDGDYLYLWINNATNLSGAAIASLAARCVRDHAPYFPQAERYCYDCRETGFASLVQSSCDIVSLCDSCLARRQRDMLVESQRANASHTLLAIFLPLALILSAVGWALFWTGYDAIFQGSNAGPIIVPHIVMVLIGVAVLVPAGAMGWAVGWLLHRSGASRLLPPRWLAVGAAVPIVVLGELLYVAYVVFRVTGMFHLPTILRITFTLALNTDPFYAAYKLVFAVALGFTIHEVAKPRDVKVRL